MKEYKVICWASEEEAEMVAVEKCGFPYVDYCEVDESQ